MTPKQYLQRLRKLDVTIDARMHELRRLEEQKSYISGVRYDNVRVQTSPSNVDGFQASEEIADLERDIKMLIAAMIAERHKIIGQIGLLDNPNQVALLLKRYVEYKPFEQIACEMGFSYIHVARIHREALVEFSTKVDIK